MSVEAMDNLLGISTKNVYIEHRVKAANMEYQFLN